jgi:adenine phosphoribosyltransferase
MKKNLANCIRDIPDFPKKGIIFKDITTLLSDKDAFCRAIDVFIERYKHKEIEKIVAADARGFIFGGILAYKLGAGFVPIRKKGKLPYKSISADYELEYGKDTLYIHEDAVSPGERVLIVDDLLATGGTAGAMRDLVKKLGGEIIEFAFLIELSFLNGREKIKGCPVFSQIVY